MKALYAFVAAIALLLAGCGASLRGVQVTPKLLARASVETVEGAWRVGSAACIQEAKAKQDDGIRQKCASAFLPIQAQMVVVANAVDTWSDASAGDTACAIADLVEGVRNQAKVLAEVGANVPKSFADAEQLGALELQFCHRPDAGAK